MAGEQLHSLVWPQVNLLKSDESKFQSGFGGTVRPSQYFYFKADNPASVTAEVRQVDKVEAPLEAQVEKEQRHADGPVEEEITEILDQIDNSKGQSGEVKEAKRAKTDLAKKTKLKFPPPATRQRQRRRAIF